MLIPQQDPTGHKHGDGLVEACLARLGTSRVENVDQNKESRAPLVEKPNPSWSRNSNARASNLASMGNIGGSDLITGYRRIGGHDSSMVVGRTQP